MCGINLIVDYSSSLDDGPIQKMNRRMMHRGPDADLFHRLTLHDKTCFFGHTRLKIIDTHDHNNQPFLSPCGRYILIYNGEIYNFRELKTGLEKKGYVFRTHGDTEVLLNLLIDLKSAAIPLLDGMFAFCFYDQQDDELLLARDRFGMKPLFYGGNGNHWIASSEIKGILASGLIEAELNHPQLGYYLRYKFARKPETFFQNIFELKEGHFLRIQKGKVEKSTFVQRKLPETKATSPDIPAITSLIKKSVEHHLISDVPMGLFLSGGVDSTLILAMIRELGVQNFPAFVMAGKAEEGSFGTRDHHFARLAAEQYGADLTEIPVHDGSLDHLDEFIASLDQPIGDIGGLMTFLLSKSVKQHVGVILSGAGADELFGGYNRHLAFRDYVEKRRFWANVASLLKAGVKILPVGFDHPFRQKFRLIRKFAEDIEASPHKTFLNFTALAFPPYQNNEESYYNREFLLEEALHTDRHRYLISDVLMMTDQTSMYHSLEVRMPYLDNNLLSVVEGIGADYLLSRGRKWLLREILTSLGGEVFCNRPKQGFGAPVGSWLRKQENRFWTDYLHNEKHILFNWIDPNKIRLVLKKHFSGREDYGAEIAALLILMRWLDQNFAA